MPEQVRVRCKHHHYDRRVGRQRRDDTHDAGPEEFILDRDEAERRVRAGLVTIVGPVGREKPGPTETKEAEPPETQEVEGPTETKEAEAEAEPDATDAAAKLAEEEGLDLYSIAGTGKDGRILKSDVEDAID